MGGVAEAVKSFISILEQKSILCEVVTLDNSGLDYLQSENTPFIPLGPSGGFGRHSRLLIPWLTINIERFDAVIINGIWGYHTYATWRVLNKLKKHNSDKKLPRVFVMPHGMLDPYFQRAKDRWFKAIRNKIYWSVIESKVINNANGLLFTSETELLLARETFKNYHPKKEYLVGYGINQPPLYNTNMRVAFNNCCPGLNGEPYLLFLGRIHLKKGVDLLIKAYISLYKKAKLSGDNLPKLVIAGPGINTGFGAKLQQELSKFPEIKEDIYFPGMLTGDAKWGAFYGCEAFVLPSHQENFGIAVVEALACSKPVLISNQVNIWPEIEAEGAGIINTDNLSGVLHMLNNWLTLTNEQKEQMSGNALTAFNKHFTLNNIALEMIKVISENVYDQPENVYSE